MEITSIITTVATIVGLLLVLRQVTLARTSVEADHLRRKKDSTFTAFTLIRDKFRQLDNEILCDLELSCDSTLEKHHFDKISNNQELLIKLRRLLSNIQLMAVGVQNDIYDLNVLFDLSGTTFINTFDRYFPYILDSRKQSVTFYQEAEYFINKLRSLRTSRESVIRNAKV